MSVMSNVSKRLAIAIAQSGKKKGAVAKAVGLTPLSLSRYLKGDRIPHRAVLVALAGELGVSIDYLSGMSSEQVQLAVTPVASEGAYQYVADTVALTGLDADDRQTVMRLLEALRSGEGDIRKHLIGQLKIIEQALQARRQQPREEQENVS